MVEIFLILEDLKRFISPKQKNPVAQLVLPEISYLTQTTHQFFQVLGQFPHANLSANKSLTLPNLTEALAYLEHRLEELGKSKQSHDYDLKQVIEFSAWLDDLKDVSHKLMSLGKMQLSNSLSSNRTNVI